MRVEIDDLEITAETELTDQQPSVFKEITLSYHITGNEKDAKKIKRASIPVHGNPTAGFLPCWKKTAPIIPKIFLNGNQI